MLYAASIPHRRRGGPEPILGPVHHSYSYDAWNRLAQVTLSGSTLTYTYDGLNRQVVENGTVARDLYYSKDWQVLEERLLGAVQTQNVWSPVYVDAMVLRDSNTSQRQARTGARR